MHAIGWLQDKIEAELASHGLLARPGARARALELEDLRALRYTAAAVKEAMRMQPVVSVMGRCGTDTTHARVRPCMHEEGGPFESSPDRDACFGTSMHV